MKKNRVMFDVIVSLSCMLVFQKRTICMEFINGLNDFKGVQRERVQKVVFYIQEFPNEIVKIDVHFLYRRFCENPRVNRST